MRGWPHRAYPALLWILALSACASSPARTPEAARINTDLGMAYLERGQLSLSKERFEKALAQRPDMPGALSGFGLLLERMGQREQAVAYHQRAVESSQNQAGHSAYRNALAVAQCRVERYGEAFKNFALAADNPLNEAPEFASANAALCALQQRDALNAERWARRALGIRPRFADANLALAEALLLQGRPRDALDLMNQFHRQSAGDAQSLSLAVKVALAAGDTQAASAYGVALNQSTPSL